MCGVCAFRRSTGLGSCSTTIPWGQRPGLHPADEGMNMGALLKFWSERERRLFDGACRVVGTWPPQLGRRAPFHFLMYSYSTGAVGRPARYLLRLARPIIGQYSGGTRRGGYGVLLLCCEARRGEARRGRENETIEQLQLRSSPSSPAQPLPFATARETAAGGCSLASGCPATFRR